MHTIPQTKMTPHNQERKQQTQPTIITNHPLQKMSSSTYDEQEFPPLDQQIQDAAKLLGKSYMEFVVLQQEILFLIEQEEERLQRLREEDVAAVAATFNKIPEYQEKLAHVTKMMSLLQKRAQKLKRRAAHAEQEAVRLKHAK